MRQWVVGLTVAVAVAAGWDVGAAAIRVAPPDTVHDAITLAQRLQDDARVLRNGVRSGAAVAVLDRQRSRLHAGLARLVESHQQWAGTLPVTDRERVAAHMSTIETGCSHLRLMLVELDGVLAAPAPDRDKVRTLGQSIGAQAARCERALRAADRTVRDG
jgi:hypothetical protein